MAERRVVLTDTNVLINFARIERLDLLGSLHDLRFCSPPEVLVEIVSEPENGLIKRCIDSGTLAEVAFSEVAELALFTELRKTMGMGEAACLAIAVGRGALVASDEKRAFLREAEARLGPDRVLNTPGILLLGIRRGALSVEEADRIKDELESKRFKMRFRSFSELA